MSRAQTIVIPLAAGGTLAAAAALRLVERKSAAELLPRVPLFPDPPVRVPLLDVLAWPLGADQLQLTLLLSLLTVAMVGIGVRLALPEGGRLAGMALAAICPTLVLTGNMFAPQALVILCASGVSILLVQTLRSDAQSPPFSLGVATAALLMSDWPAASPVLAWLGWLVFFRPAWLAPTRARRALLGLSAGAGVALLAYALILTAGARPGEALGASHFPVGAAAVTQLFGSVSGLWVGSSDLDGSRIEIASGLVFVGAALVGWRRAHRAGAPAWASVLWVGSFGALVPALAIHQALPFAAYKNLWFMTPMLITLSIAALWPIVRFHAEDHPGQEKVRAAASTPGLGLLGILLFGLPLVVLSACTDADGAGWTSESGDCDDEDDTIHPDAPEAWDDGLDNDCDGTTDWSADYVLLDEAEPNDSSLGSCFAPEGQDLGHVAGTSLLTRISGRIDSVVDESYEEGDRDCYAFRLPSVVDHPHLTLHLSWDDPESDLDLALQGLWQGVQVGFAQSQASGPGPEYLVSSSGFDSGALLWLWVVGYDGPPTYYRVDLVLR